MSDDHFAPSLGDLAKTGIGVTVDPAPLQGLSLDATGKVPFSALPFKAFVFGSSLFSFVTSSISATVNFSNLTALKQPGGALYTPTAVFATSNQSSGGRRICCSISGVSAGAFSVTGESVDGSSINESVTFYYLAIVA